MRTTRWFPPLYLITFICFILVLDTALSGGLTHAAIRRQTYIITILNATDPQGFMPTVLSAHPGDLIRFVNADTVSRQIIVASSTSPEIAAGRSWDFIAPAKGIYLYQDSTNPMLAGNLAIVSAADQFISQIKPASPPSFPFATIGILIVALLLLAIVFFRFKRFHPKWMPTDLHTSTSDVTMRVSQNDDDSTL